MKYGYALMIFQKSSPTPGLLTAGNQGRDDFLGLDGSVDQATKFVAG